MTKYDCIQNAVVTASVAACLIASMVFESGLGLLSLFMFYWIRVDANE